MFKRLSDEEIVKVKKTALESCFPQTNKLPEGVADPELFWMDKDIAQNQLKADLKAMIKLLEIQSKSQFCYYVPIQVLTNLKSELEKMG